MWGIWGKFLLFSSVKCKKLESEAEKKLFLLIIKFNYSNRLNYLAMQVNLFKMDMS